MPRGCPAERDWHLFLDGELDRDRSEALRAHLAGCSCCQAIHGEALGLARSLAGWVDEPVPAALTASLLRMARSRPHLAGTGTARQWGTVFLLAAVLALAAYRGRVPVEGIVDGSLLLEMAVGILQGIGQAMWWLLPRLAWAVSWPGVVMALVAGLGLGAVAAGLNALWARRQWG